jgi:hypothetical protein
MNITMQTAWLFLLAIPIACASWTVTHEEIFKEPRNYCKLKSESGSSIITRKFFYLFTCEYCFSHYVTTFFIIITGYKLLMNDWRGYIIAGFALVWVANMYMGLFLLLKQGIKKEKTEIEYLEIEKDKL